MTFLDRINPIKNFSKYTGHEEGLFPALYDAVTNFGALKIPTEEFELEQPDDISIETLSLTPWSLRFLQMLVLIKQPKRVLEIGTFVGLSAIYMASVMPPNSSLITIEFVSKFAKLARQNFVRNGLESKIQLMESDAFEALKTLASGETFDLVFMDGAKENYSLYFKLLDPILAPGGLLVVDDVLFNGEVLNPEPVTEKGQGVRDFLELVKNNVDYSKVMLPLDYGIMLMHKNGVK